MKPEVSMQGEAWLSQWLGGVADGSATMSQRKLSVIERKVGLAAARRAARARGVHLVQLTDDRGEALIAASRDAFTVIC